MQSRYSSSLLLSAPARQPSRRLSPPPPSATAASLSLPFPFQRRWWRKKPRSIRRTGPLCLLPRQWRRWPARPSPSHSGDDGGAGSHAKTTTALNSAELEDTGHDGSARLVATVGRSRLRGRTAERTTAGSSPARRRQHTWRLAAGGGGIDARPAGGWGGGRASGGWRGAAARQKCLVGRCRTRWRAEQNS